MKEKFYFVETIKHKKKHTEHNCNITNYEHPLGWYRVDSVGWSALSKNGERRESYQFRVPDLYMINLNLNDPFVFISQKADEDMIYKEGIVRTMTKTESATNPTPYLGKSWDIKVDITIQYPAGSSYMSYRKNDDNKKGIIFFPNEIYKREYFVKNSAVYKFSKTIPYHTTRKQNKIGDIVMQMKPIFHEDLSTGICPVLKNDIYFFKKTKASTIWEDDSRGNIEFLKKDEMAFEELTCPAKYNRAKPVAGESPCVDTHGVRLHYNKETPPDSEIYFIGAGEAFKKDGGSDVVPIPSVRFNPIDDIFHYYDPNHLPALYLEKKKGGIVAGEIDMRFHIVVINKKMGLFRSFDNAEFDNNYALTEPPILIDMEKIGDISKRVSSYQNVSENMINNLKYNDLNCERMSNYSTLSPTILNENEFVDLRVDNNQYKYRLDRIILKNVILLDLKGKMRIRLTWNNGIKEFEADYSRTPVWVEMANGSQYYSADQKITKPFYGDVVIRLGGGIDSRWFSGKITALNKMEIGGIVLGTSTQINCVDQSSVPSFKGFTKEDKNSLLGTITINNNERSMVSTSIKMGFIEKKECLNWYKKALRVNKEAIYYDVDSKSLGALSHSGFIRGIDLADGNHSLILKLEEFSNN